MQERVQFWCTIVRKTVAIVLYCQVPWLPVAIATMCCTLRWCENLAEPINCTSPTWVRPVCSRSKRNCCARDWVRVRSSMSDRNQTDSKSYCWAQTMVPHCFYGTKARVTSTCGTQRHYSNHRISWKCRRAAIVDCPHKCLPATSVTCGPSRVISTILSRIKWVALQWCICGYLSRCQGMWQLVSTRVSIRVTLVFLWNIISNLFPFNISFHSQLLVCKRR